MDSGRRALGSSFLGVQWLCGCLAAILLMLTYRTSAAYTCTSDPNNASNMTMFKTQPTCLDTQFPPDRNGQKLLVWSLRDNATNYVTIVVAAPLDESEWIGLGFSEAGQMPGSTAVVATLGVTGSPLVQPYYLRDRSSNGVIKDDSRLILPTRMNATYDGTLKTVFMAFRVDFASSKIVPNYLLYAAGQASGDGSIINYHRTRSLEEMQANSQFPLGGAVGESAVSKLEKRVKTHGALQVFGWGVLLPIGAIVARYAREYDPAWFYIHATFQIIGFIFIIAGVATGVALAKDVEVPGLNGHKGLGLFLLILAILQVLAVVFRPKKDSNTRKYWNWYHWWVGRLALFLACINVFVGLNLSNGERKLRVSYIVLLAFELVAFAILETIYWVRWNRAPANSSGVRWNRASTERGFQMSDY